MSTPSAVPSQTASPSRAGAREIVAVLLVLSAVLFLVLPLGVLWAAAAWSVGVALMWSSDAWSVREKLLGTLVWPGGLIGPLALLTSAGQVCTQIAEGGSGSSSAVSEPVCTGFAFDPVIGIPLAIISVAAPIAVAGVLLHRASR